jgi:DNA helicase-4
MPTLPIEADSLEQLVQANRSFQTTTLKQVSLDKNNYSNDKQTKHGEKVRSKEEQIIANFLYINSISYTYEKPYPRYSQYKPDFTITKYSEPIYLEHQGIDRSGNTRKDIDKKYYASKMQWNKQYHRDNGTRLIETYSYEFQEGTILKNLTAKLKQQGVQIIRRQEAEISELIHKTYSYDVNELNKLFIAYLGLVKTSAYSLTDIKTLLKRSKHSYHIERSRAFIALFETIYELYEATLKATGSIDFSDMIISAAENISELPAGAFEYDYILVDEVQDLSDARYKLLKALLDRVPQSKLFAVGDDWQSIFRFAGSDLTLVNDFEQKFARHTYHSTIEQTHRFNNPLLDISSSFIKKNPSQIRKSPYSTVKHLTELNVNALGSRNSDTTALASELQNLLDAYGFDTIRERTLFIIARYKKDALRLLNTYDNRMQFRQLDDDGTLYEWTDTRTGHRLQLSFMTMHSSKGQTCDHAFILNANDGARGIPALRENDPVLQLLLAHEDAYPNAEERRLFYVAITRAQYSTTLLTQSYNTSAFVTELGILQQQPNDPTTQCPNCLSGKLIRRESSYGPFLGCSNYGFGCNYSQKL